MRSPLLTATLVLALTTAATTAQTRIEAPDNSYKVEQDVQLGRDAAAEARKSMPLLRDGQVTSYVEELGQRLVAAIPPELRHDEFRYTFEVVNVRDINAF